MDPCPWCSTRRRRHPKDHRVRGSHLWAWGCTLWRVQNSVPKHLQGQMRRLLHPTSKEAFLQCECLQDTADSALIFSHAECPTLRSRWEERTKARHWLNGQVDDKRFTESLHQQSRRSLLVQQRWKIHEQSLWKAAKSSATSLWAEQLRIERISRRHHDDWKAARISLHWQTEHSKRELESEQEKRCRAIRVEHLEQCSLWYRDDRWDWEWVRLLDREWTLNAWIWFC